MASLVRGFTFRNAASNPKARLTGLKIYRNRIERIGFRCSDAQGGAAIDLNGPEVADIAGNVIRTLAKQGININGGRPMGGMMSAAQETPLVRIQVRHNQVKDSIWYKTDFGGIEFWQTGPAYVYGNISVNPIGWLSHNKYFHKNQAFYFDHGFKAALFNNIGWSDNQPKSKAPIGDYFIHEIRNRWNEVFQNTAYNLRGFQTHSSEHGEQQFYIGNLMLDMTDQNFSHWRLAEADSIAYANNLSNNNTRNYYNRWRGDVFQTIDEFRDHIKSKGNLLSTQVGWVSDDPLVADPEKHDFRPVENSAAIDRGAKVFLPWSLYGNVGEWHFRGQPNAPGTVLSHDLYPQEFSNSMDLLRAKSAPNNDLQGEGFAIEDYEERQFLQDWCRGALKFDGTKTMTIPHERLMADVKIKKGDKETVTPGSERRTLVMDTNSFIIETVFRMCAPKPGFIGSQMDEAAGYALGINARGTADPHAEIRRRSRHILHRKPPLRTEMAPPPRRSGIARPTRSSSISMARKVGAIFGRRSLRNLPCANAGDFTVGENFQGSLDSPPHLPRHSRRCGNHHRGTPLLAVQRPEPPRLLRPAHRRRAPRCRSHREPDRLRPGADQLHPTETTSAGSGESECRPRQTDKFLEGPDRSIKQQGWGSVSVPKHAKPGENITVQVAFATETIPKDMRLRIDFHGMINGKRKPGIGQARTHPGQARRHQPLFLRLHHPENPRPQPRDRRHLRLPHRWLLRQDPLHGGDHRHREINMEKGTACPSPYSQAVRTPYPSGTVPAPAPPQGFRCEVWSEGFEKTFFRFERADEKQGAVCR